MCQLLLLFVHLLAVCTALGAIVATDLRLLRKLAAPKVRIAPPNRFVTRLVAASLAVLLVSGAGLIGLSTGGAWHALANPKLQGKLVCVALLCANAAVLHGWTFPWLARARKLSAWSIGDGLRVAAPVALSNSLWLYCAFLGIARPWNHVVPLQAVLSVALTLFLLALGGSLLLLAVASRGQPSDGGDWIDRLKRGLGVLGAALNA